MKIERKIVAALRWRERHAFQELGALLTRKRVFDAEVLRASTAYYEARACAEAARALLG
jgi:hypothetical protein